MTRYTVQFNIYVWHSLMQYVNILQPRAALCQIDDTNMHGFQNIYVKGACAVNLCARVDDRLLMY